MESTGFKLLQDLPYDAVANFSHFLEVVESGMERKLTVVVVALRGGENVKMKTGKKKNERFLWLRECVKVLKTQVRAVW